MKKKIQWKSDETANVFVVPEEEQAECEVSAQQAEIVVLLRKEIVSADGKIKVVIEFS